LNAAEISNLKLQALVPSIAASAIKVVINNMQPNGYDIYVELLDRGFALDIIRYTQTIEGEGAYLIEVMCEYSTEKEGLY